MPNFVIFREYYAIKISQFKLTLRKQHLSVDFTTYFTVIQTKTYTPHVSTWSKSISDKNRGEKASKSSKIGFLDVKTTFGHTFPSSRLAMFAPWRFQNPLRIKEESDSGKSFIA